MFNCTICGIYTASGSSVEDFIGNPPHLIIELIEQCLGKLEILLVQNMVCDACTDKLTKYYETKCLAENLQQELLDLFKFSSYHLKKTLCYDEDNSINIITNSNSNFDEEEDEGGSPYFKNEITDEEYTDHLSIKVDDDYEVENDIIESEIDATSVIKRIYSPKNCISQQKQERKLLKTRQSEEIKCSVCGQSFKNKRAFRTHNKKTHFSGFVCDQCGKTLHSYSGFLSHQRNHNPVKKYQCNLCKEAYNSKSSLKLHLAWHTGEKPFQCDICNKNFTHNVGLYKHKQIHDEKTRRIECDKCGSKFRSNAHLNRHMLTHTKAKPFGCSICDCSENLDPKLQIFMRQNLLKRLMVFFFLENCKIF